MALILFYTHKKLSSPVVVNLNIDPYWDKVVFLSHFDASPYFDEKGKSISATATISTANKKYGTSASLHTGSNSAVVAANSDFSFSGDFTIEGYVNFSSISATPALYSPSNQYIFDIGANNFIFRYNAGVGWIVCNPATTTLIAHNVVPLVNTWYHWAVTRQSSVLRLFIDGVLVGSLADYSTLLGGNSAITIGNYGGGANYGVNGYIDEFRVTKGLARYTSSFEPLLLPFPSKGNELSFDYYWDKTALLILGGNTNKFDATFIDSSANAYAITKTGTPLQGYKSPFAEGNVGNSIYFDGTTKLATNKLVADALAGDYTVEAWVFLTVLPTTTTYTGASAIMSAGSIYHIWAITSAGYLITSKAGTPYINIPGAIPALNTWAHVAFVNQGTTTTVFLNGVAVGSVEALGTWYAGQVVYIGAAGTANFKGHISNLRVTTSALYTADFTTSTTPLTALPETVLLLNTDSQGISSNSTIFDSSNNRVTINKTGNITQGTISPFVEFGGSMYFDGSSVATFTYPATGSFGTGDFTIEFWIKTSALLDNKLILDSRNGAANGWTITTGGYSGSTIGGLRFSRNSSDTVGLTPTTLIVPNVWTHCAIVRVAGTATIFINGINSGSIANTDDYITSGTFYISRNSYVNSGHMTGYLSNVRLVKGTALYTTDFNVPVSPLTNIAGTVLLLSNNCDVVDSCKLNNLEVSGGVTVNGSTKKLGGLSLAFDGASSYVKTNIKTEDFFNLSDYTVEAWFYSASNTSTRSIFSTYSIAGTGNGTGVSLEWYGTSKIAFFSFALNSASTPIVQSTSTLVVNTWHHVALCKIGTQHLLFVNGKLESSANATYTVAAGGQFYIGNSLYAVATRGWNGYIDDFRLTRGISRYVSSFAPKTLLSLGTAAQSFDKYYNETVLLMHMNGVDNGSTFSDVKGKAITRAGSTVTKTSKFKFGTASAYFNGTTDYLTILDSEDFNFGTGDFTIEFFASTTTSNTSTASCIFSQSIVDATSDSAIYVGFGSDVSVQVSNGTGWTYSATASTVKVNTGLWHHIAIVRFNTALMIFVDGILSSTTAVTNSFSLANSTKLVTIGAQNGANYFFNGYIDELRITKGVARYTFSFNPPTEELTSVSTETIDYDPYWNEVSFSMPLDTLTDSKGAIVTNVSASSVIDNSVGAFSGKSSYKNVVGGGILSTISALGTGSFTIETWFRPSAFDAVLESFIVDTRTDNSNVVGGLVVILTPTSVGVSASNGTTLISIVSATKTLNLNTWYHLAVIRTGVTTRIFVNGILLATGVDTSNYTLTNMKLGCSAFRSALPNTSLVGNIQDFRITKGLARYVGNFSLPTRLNPQFGAAY